jgi:hypothetical protein
MRFPGRKKLTAVDLQPRRLLHRCKSRRRRDHTIASLPSYLPARAAARVQSIRKDGETVGVWERVRELKGIRGNGAALLRRSFAGADRSDGARSGGWKTWILRGELQRFPIKVKNSALFHLAQPFSRRYTRYNVLIARYIKN